MGLHQGQGEKEVIPEDMAGSGGRSRRRRRDSRTCSVGRRRCVERGGWTVSVGIPSPSGVSRRLPIRILIFTVAQAMADFGARESGPAASATHGSGQDGRWSVWSVAHGDCQQTRGFGKREFAPAQCSGTPRRFFPLAQPTLRVRVESNRNL